MNDDRLHDAFKELRRAETAHVPSFKRLWDVEPALSRLRSRLRVGSTFAFAVVLLIVLAVAIIPRRPAAPSISTWRAPTDFLLQTPGRELLDSVPDLKGTRQ
ncbi:MAG: hypothetical protein DMF58_03640 [Acidobacteria bacterium]|nr:MAG: hypothetical protein DMF58_03640 [Acidobacteriota bacterium]